MREAAVFDGVDAAGAPVISTDRPRITDPVEREKVEQFLAGGKFVLRTSARGIDRIAPDRGRKVPIFYVTDGEWVWSRAVKYYFVEHDIPLRAEFLEHIRSKGYVAETPTEEQVAQAMAMLSEANTPPA